MRPKRTSSIMAVARTKETLARQQMIHLTNRDCDLFLAALEADVRPNQSLRKAAERFKRSYKDATGSRTAGFEDTANHVK